MYVLGVSVDHGGVLQQRNVQPTTPPFPLCCHADLGSSRLQQFPYFLNIKTTVVFDTF